jgi:DNA-binding NarL/FixJ family response regulator
MRSNNHLSNNGPQKRILLVDRHPVFRHGLALLIGSQKDFVVCGEADTAVEGLRLATDLKPDLVMVSLILKMSQGIGLLNDLRLGNPALPVLVLCMLEERLYGERVLRAGGRGYIMKDAPGEEVLVAMRQVLSGRLYLSHELGTQLLSPLTNCGRDLSQSPEDRLSDRELEVLQLLGKAYETKKIAETLSVSVKTVESYREHLKVKLNLANSTQLIRHAVEWVGTNRLE